MIDLGNPNFDDKEVFIRFKKWIRFWGHLNRQFHRFQLYEFVGSEIGRESDWFEIVNEVQGIGDVLILIWRDHKHWIEMSHAGEVFWLTDEGVNHG